MKLWIERLRKFAHLPPREVLILFQAWILFLFVELALRLISFTSLLTVCQLTRAKKRDNVALNPSVARLAWLVERASQYSMTESSCLKQALVLSWLLRRRGIATTIRIGVARKGGILTAHAWVEQQGEIIFGLSGGERYEPLLPPTLMTGSSE